MSGAPVAARPAPVRREANPPAPLDAERGTRSVARGLPAVLRVLLLLVLAFAVAAWPPWRAPAAGPSPGAVWLTDGAAVPDSVLLGAAALVVRPSVLVPTAQELEALAAAAARSPLLVALPDAGVALAPISPERPRADRAAALNVRVFGPPGEEVLVRLGEDGVAVDSLRVRLDADGAGLAGFALRPARAGWHEWRVDAGDARAVIGAWVREAARLRVLLAAGDLGWESAFAVRALEEAGARVERIQPLGPGLLLSDGTAVLPASAAALAGFDAVVLAGEVSLTPDRAAALASYVSDHGGGLVVAGPTRGAPLPLGIEMGAPRQLRGTQIRWAAPAELAPLPAAELATAAWSVERLPVGAAPAAATDGGALLALVPFGRGRIAALGLGETWRWRMEAGRIEEHRSFWRNLVEWTAGGARDAAVIRLRRSHGPVGARVEVDLLIPAGDVARAAASGLVLTRPGGDAESLPLETVDRSAGLLRARFVPAQAGEYRLAAPETAAAAGYVASAAPLAAADAWARLALLADASGGAALPASALPQRVRQWEAEHGIPPVRRWPWAVLLFGAVLGLAAAEWALRRLGGERCAAPGRR